LPRRVDRDPSANKPTVSLRDLTRNSAYSPMKILGNHCSRSEKFRPWRGISFPCSSRGYGAFSAWYIRWLCLILCSSSIARNSSTRNPTSLLYLSIIRFHCKQMTMPATSTGRTIRARQELLAPTSFTSNAMALRIMEFTAT
jgi:hypothetical protein